MSNNTKSKSVLIIVLSLIFFACQNKNTGTSRDKQTQKTERKGSELKLSSSSFKDGEMIPVRYTCEGENLSPQLSWTGIPVGTKSLAILCDDPDAPAGDWVHWVVFNIPPEATELQESFPRDKKLNDGSCQGSNDFGKYGYDGPCPPSGTHRYFFKLYAVDKLLEKDTGITKAELLEEIEGHVLGQVQIKCKYKR
jgi:hypothetical protein